MYNAVRFTKKIKTQKTKKTKTQISNILLLIILLLSFSTQFITLPTANKTPFYDYDVNTNTNNWWEGIDTNWHDLRNPAENSYFEIAVCLYLKSSGDVEVRMGFALSYLGQAWDTNGLKITINEPGFYIAYLTFYHTDANYVYFAVYKNNGEKVNEVSISPDVYTGSDNKICIYANSGGKIIVSKINWYKTLSSGSSYTFAPLWSALDWILYDVDNPQVKVVRIESSTSPVTVQIFSSDGNKFYEQGFGDSDTTYVFCNDTKITVFTYGPAGSKSVDITENGLWIVIVNSSLTDIYLNSTGEEEGDENQTTGFTLNVSVVPDTYWIKFYNYSTGDLIQKSQGNSVLTGLANNTKIRLKIYTADEVTLKINEILTITHDTTLRYVFDENIGKQYNVTIKVKDTEGNEIVANIYVDGVKKAMDTEWNGLLTYGTHTLYITKDGYKAFYGGYFINENKTITVILIEDTTENEDLQPGIDNYINITDYPNATQTGYNNNVSAPSEDFYGFKFVNCRNTQVQIAIYGIKTHPGGYTQVPLGSLTIDPNQTVYYYLLVDDVNQAMSYKWLEKGEAFDIYVDGVKYFAGVPMTLCENKYPEFVIREGFGYGFSTPMQSTTGGSEWTSVFGGFGGLFGILIMVIFFVLLIKMADVLD